MMDILFTILALLVPIALFAVFLASFRSGWEILKYGNSIDPLRREIEEENRKREKESASGQVKRAA